MSDERTSNNHSEPQQHITHWDIDPQQSEISFTISQAMINEVRGRFTSFRGDLMYDHQLERPSGVMVEIDVKSIDTGQIQRDIHLRSGDFLDVENYPQIRFASRDVEPTGENRYALHGDLRMLRTTRAVTLDVLFKGFEEDANGPQRALFSATTEINRHDFGLTWNRMLDNGGVMIGDAIRIDLEIQAAQQLGWNGSK